MLRNEQKLSKPARKFSDVPLHPRTQNMNPVFGLNFYLHNKNLITRHILLNFSSLLSFPLPRLPPHNRVDTRICSAHRCSWLYAASPAH